MNAIMVRAREDSRLIARISTIRDNYTGHVSAWLRWLADTGQGIDEEGIRAYFRFLLAESGYAAATVRVKRQAIKKRIRQAFADADDTTRTRIDRLLADLDHEHDTKAPKIQAAPVERDKVLRPDQFAQLLEACGSDRQRAFLRFLYETGCRVSEMTGARLDRCDVGAAAVKLRIMGKGSKERTVRIRRETFDYIRSIFNGSEYLFETGGGKPYSRVYVTEQVKRVSARIGRELSAHCLRHSFASRMVQAFPGKVDAVSRYLGHSSPSITLGMYCHATLSDEELFEAIA